MAGNSVSNYLKNIKYIEDGEVVESSVERRPIDGLKDNIENLAKIEEVKQGLIKGVWDLNTVYSKGDTVVFLSDIYTSLTNNNKGNIPVLPTTKKSDDYWKIISPAKGVNVKSYFPSTINGSLLNDMFPDIVNFLENKGFKRFTVYGRNQYTIMCMSRGIPLNKNLILYVETDKYVSCIELELVYFGMDKNINNQVLPELNIKHCSISCSDGYEISEDEFGKYGIVFKTMLRTDDLISLCITTRDDCNVYISGVDGYESYPDYNNEKTNSSSYIERKYIANPYTGDNIPYSIDKLNLNIPKLLTQNLNWNVGAGEDFTTLEDAIYESAKYVNTADYSITITLKRGFKFTKSLLFKGLTLPHVVIVSEDDWVLFDATPTANPDFYIQYQATPIAISFVNCTTPTISFKLKIETVQRSLVIGFGFCNCLVKMKNSGVYGFYWGVALVSSYGSTFGNYYENCFNSAELADNNSMLLTYVPTYKNCAGNILWIADGSQGYCVSGTWDGLFENINSVCEAVHIASYCANNTNSFKNMNNTNSYAYNLGTYGGQVVFNRNQTAPGLTLCNLTPGTFSQYGKVTLY